MICIASPFPSPPSKQPTPAWHAGFLAMLPAIIEQARFAVRRLPASMRQEIVQDAVAYAVVAYKRLFDLGKVDLAYPSALARYGVAQCRNGRQVGGHVRSRDVLSDYGRRKRGRKVVRLDHQDPYTGQWREAVVEDHRTPVPDQAAFRIDFPRWLGKHPARQRRIAMALAAGERTKDVARKFCMSPARISQLRREFEDSWREFQGDDPVSQGKCNPCDAHAPYCPC